MCGRYGYVGGSKIKERFSIQENVEDFAPKRNIAPSFMVPVVINHKGKRMVVKMKWGFIPRWSKDLKFPQINAKAEGIEDKAYFKSSFKDRRCLVPASFFYEWLKVEKDKIPYLIRPLDQDIFSFAGLYDVVKDADDKAIVTFTIITCEPNELMVKIHNRMPVILHPVDEDTWLNPDANEAELLKLLVPYPSDEMEAYPVSKLVNNPENEGEEILKKIDP